MTKSTFSRRQFGALAGAAALSPALSTRAAADGHANTIKIGWLGPQSGPLANFASANEYLAGVFNAKHADGIEIGGKTYGIELMLADTQSDPIRASQETRDLINGAQPDLIIGSATPETNNPILDACEAAGTPGITTIAPWEACYFGRGAKPGEPSPFKWSFHFSFGAQDFVPFYIDLWNKFETNKKVGFLIPNDADGNAVRGGLVPAFEAAGFEVFDAGPYENFSTDFSNQIQYFKDNGVEIVNAWPFPPDFPVFWRQAAQLGLAQQIKIMQVAKAGLFPAEMEALGQLGYGVTSGAFWHPSMPTSSPALGLTSAEIATGFEEAIGGQWTQTPGGTAALLDVAVAALKASGDPKNKEGVAAAIGSLTTETAVGTVDFANGPVPGAIASTPLIGGQWVKDDEGPYEFKMEIVGNAVAPDVPLTGELKPFRLGG